jgi:UDP-N-acetylmuramate--alanine ligase
MTARPAPLDLTLPGRYHVVGAGGPGMSALALVLAQMGHRVSGSDIREVPVLHRLRAAGVEISVGHDRSLVHGVDAVTYSTAIPDWNVELAEARALGIPVLHRAAMLASICARARSIGVAGTHGKTTTTSMLMLVLAEAGLRPSFVVGGDVSDMGTGAQWTGSGLLVVEADESDKTHLQLPLSGTVLTNVEPDHLEHYGAFDAVVDGFREYLAAIDGPLVLCSDDPLCAGFAREFDTVTYGTGPEARFRATDLEASRGTYRFTVERDGEPLGSVELPLRGVHNVRNATGTIAMAAALGVPFEVAASALTRFGGVARRFDFRGQHNGVTLIDDYAHLPTEIAASIEAARTGGDGWQRIVAVFQPNRFRRMAVLSPEYRDAFVGADLTVITDIYPSGDAPIPGVTGKLVVDAVLDAHPAQRVAWIPRRNDLVEYVARELRPGDVCISMGCGDIASFPDEILARWGVDGAEAGDGSEGRVA